MMTARLLDDLRRLDVHLVVDGNHLRVDAPRGMITSEVVDALRDRKAEIIRLLSVGQNWETETRRLIDWFLSTSPPAEPFQLHPGVWIARPAHWWASLRDDIALGPDKGRAYYGALQKDLRRLAELLGGPVER